MQPAEQGEALVRINLLGPFEVIVEGAPVDVPRTRVRDLLTLLADRSPDVVTHDALVDEIWAESLPKNPRAALRVILSRARAALGPQAAALTTTPTGMRLQASTDVQEFLSVDLMTDDPEELFGALSLWRGEPYASLLPSAAMAAHTHRVNRWRLQLIARLGAVLTAQGRPTAAIGELEDHVRANPTNEELATCAARAFAAAGRKAAALRTLESTREALRNELGVSPSSSFEDVERSVLSDAFDLSPGADDTEGAVSTGQARFVGRESEMNQLLGAAAGATVVVGEPGVGKTRLLDEYVATLDYEGVTTVRVACSQSPHQAMQPLADLLKALPPPSEAVGPETAAALRRIDPSLAADPGDRVTAPIRRNGVMSRLAAYVTGSLREHKATLVIDDVHWIDRGSAEVLNSVLEDSDLGNKELGNKELRLVFAMRPTPAGERVPLGGDGVDRIVVNGLAQRATTQLLEAELGSPAGAELAETIHEQSAGNPFFVRLLAGLSAEGVFHPTERLSMTILVAVQARIDMLSGPARQTLLTASVLGQSIDLELLAAVRPEAERDIDEAVDQGIVALDDDGDGARFVHALMAQGAYELLSEGQKSDLHDQFALVLADSEERIIEFARHAERSEAHDPDRCIDAHIRAAQAYLDTFSSLAALGHAQAALQALDRWQIPDPALRAQAKLLEGEALRWDSGEESMRAFLDAVELARKLEHADLLIKAVLGLCSRGQNTFAGSVNVAAAEAVDELLEQVDLSDEQRARVLAGSAILFAVSAAEDEARRRFSDAISIAQRVGNDQLEAEILSETDFGLSHPDDFGRRREATERLAQLAGGAPDLRWEAAWLQFGVATRTADGLGAIDACLSMRRDLDLVVQRPRRFGMAMVEAVVSQVGGRFADAEVWAEQALIEGRARYPESWAINAYCAVVLGIRRAQGCVGELLPIVESLLGDLAEFPAWHVGLAYSAVSAGEPHRAVGPFERLAADDFRSIATDGSWTSAIGLLAEVAAELDRPVEAARLYALLKPFQGQMLWSGVSPYGPVDASLARAAEIIGQPSLAAEHSAIAVDMERRLATLGEISLDSPKPN